MRRPILAASIALAASLLLGPIARAQLAFPAPESIRLGLSVLAQVVASTGRMIAAGRYAQLPAQSNELEAGIESVLRGVGDPPPAFKTQLVPLIAQLRVASGALREAATHHRESMLPVVHDQLAEAVQSLISLFPENLRPPASAGEPKKD